MKTFADRAKSIKKRYPHADRVSADKAAMDSELMALFQEQEMYKQQNNIPGPQDQQFAVGGKDDANYFLDKVMADFDVIPTFEELQANKNLNYTNDNIKRWTPTGDTLQFGESADLSKADGSYTSTDSEDSFWNPKNLNIASGVTSALGNLINRADVKDAKRIDPTLVNPTFKFNETDLTPYMTALDEELASTRYGFLEAGADFDTTSAGIIKANNAFAQQRGQIKVEESRLNQAEAARGDEIMNKALYFNAANATQADIDQAARQDIAEQRRRDYLAAISQDISSIFADEGNRKMAELLAPILGNVGAMEGILASGNKTGV